MTLSYSLLKLAQLRKDNVQKDNRHTLAMKNSKVFINRKLVNKDNLQFIQRKNRENGNEKIAKNV